VGLERVEGGERGGGGARRGGKLAGPLAVGVVLALAEDEVGEEGTEG